jgi:phosphotransferase system HPr-like phosphotransfer protein
MAGTASDAGLVARPSSQFAQQATDFSGSGCGRRLEKKMRRVDHGVPGVAR